MLSNLTGRYFLAGGNRNRRPDRFAHTGTGRHDAGGTQCHMRYTDIASGKPEIFDISGIKRTVRDAEITRSGVKDRRFAAVTETGGVVIVHRPAAVSDYIIKTAAAFHIMLIEQMIPHITAALPFARQETDPIQSPVIGIVVAVIFDMIPNTEGHFEQFIPEFFGIADRVIFAAEFQPPEVLPFIQYVRTAGQIIV